MPARAILLGSAFGFIVMLLNWIAPEKLFNFLMNSSGALMMFTYIFVAVAHFRFPYIETGAAHRGRRATDRRRRRRWRCWRVMVAMSFMPSKQPEMVGQPVLPGGDRRRADRQARGRANRRRSMRVEEAASRGASCAGVAELVTEPGLVHEQQPCHARVAIAAGTRAASRAG